MFKTKPSLLLIAIFLLNVDFLLSYPVFADEVSGNDKVEFVSRFNSTGSFNRASNPNCGEFITASVLSTIKAVISAIIVRIGVGMLSSVFAPLAPFIIAISIVTLIYEIIGVWKAVGGLVICQHSFVRHPVARSYDGEYRDSALSDKKYEDCTNKNYQKEDEYFKCFDRENNSLEVGKKIEKDVLGPVTDNKPDGYYWPKNGVQYSEYIEICHRNVLTFGNLFNANYGLERE